MIPPNKLRDELQAELRDRLRRLAATSPQSAGPEIEDRLLEMFRTRHARKQRLVRGLAALAACLVLALGVYWFSLQAPRQSARRVAPEIPPSGAAEFIALPYAQSEVPLEHAVVVRVNIPPAQARALGVPFDPGARSRISADLLIGQDGMARAVRFVP